MHNNASKCVYNTKFHFDNIFWPELLKCDLISLYQIGDIYCDNSYILEDHEQVCYEISYVVSGKGCFYTNGKTYDLNEGDVHICLPNQIHGGEADRIEPFRYFYLGFYFDYCKVTKQNALYHIQKVFDQITYPVTEDRLGIESLFSGVFNEILEPNNYSDLMIKSYLNQIIIYTYRNFHDDWEKTYLAKCNVDSSKKIAYKIINYIDNNLYEINELSELSEVLSYSYPYLSRVFAQETGFTIKHYYDQKRFKAALNMLRQGNLTISQIAEKLKYQSIHSFSNAFRNAIGVSPMQYQKIYKNKKRNA